MTISEDLRGTVTEILRATTAIGNDVHDYANRALRVVEPASIALVILLLAEKARRILRAVEALSDRGLDDQIGTLARSALETAIDVEYLSADTTRRIKRRDVLLDVAYKAELFMTHHVVLGVRLFPDSVAPKIMEAAGQLRTKRGLPASHPYWHCSTTKLICEELKQRADRVPPGNVGQSYDIFSFLSTFVHSHPHDAMYLVESDGRVQLSDRYEDLMPLTTAITCCLDIFVQAGVRLDRDVAPNAPELIGNLTDVLRALLQHRATGP
jgi:Family of unknown function (DUF5677)